MAPQSPQTQPSARRAIIIGGSMSGLFVGHMLRAAGWQVDIYEKVVGELSGRGAGIVAQPQIIAALQSLGLETGDLGVAVQKRRLFDTAGKMLRETDLAQVMTAWERVYRLLHAAFPAHHYHQGRTLQALTQDDSGVTATFTNGQSETADLLIGADGIRSTVRGLCAPQDQPLYAGYIAWRALIAEADMPRDMHDAIFPVMAFCLPPREQILGYPVAGADNDLRPGHRRYNLIWYRPADEETELVSLLTDEKGVSHALSIPPPLISRASIAAMRKAAHEKLAPQLAKAMDLASQPLLQPIFDLQSSRLAYGRVAMIGDAAFVARPHVGGGVAKAAGDAEALVTALQANDSIASALRQFEAERLPTGRLMVEHARKLGSYLQAQQSVDQAAISARHSIPEVVMAETATLDFLGA